MTTFRTATTRKGLFARDPDDMTAWDSVVGHHLGLTHALKTFAMTIKKRVDDEVYEVHRHGVMHGSIVNFDHVIVATKAWNMLFAVADWARATTKSQAPEPPKPSLRESIQQWSDTQKTKEKIAAWQPATLTPADDGFEDHEIHQLTISFLTAWRDKNYGDLASYPSRLMSGAKRKSEIAGENARAVRQLRSFGVRADRTGELCTGDLAGSWHRHRQW